MFMLCMLVVIDDTKMDNILCNVRFYLCSVKNLGQIFLMPARSDFTFKNYTCFNYFD